jgi:hypothetical protein
MLQLVAHWSAARPQLWNIPQKQRFLELTPEARQPIVRMLVSFIDFVILLVYVLFIDIQVTMYRVAVGATSGLSHSLMLTIFGIVGLIIIGGLVFNVRVARAVLDGTDSTRAGTAR